MRVVVDLDTCVFAAPEVFHLDGSGKLGHVTEPDDALREAVEEATDAYPLQATRLGG
jgi:ferredoxin